MATKLRVSGLYKNLKSKKARNIIITIFSIIMFSLLAMNEVSIYLGTHYGKLYYDYYGSEEFGKILTDDGKGIILPNMLRLLYDSDSRAYLINVDNYEKTMIANAKNTYKVNFEKRCVVEKSCIENIIQDSFSEEQLALIKSYIDKNPFEDKDDNLFYKEELHSYLYDIIDKMTEDDLVLSEDLMGNIEEAKKIDSELLAEKESLIEETKTNATYYRDIAKYEYNTDSPYEIIIVDDAQNEHYATRDYMKKTSSITFLSDYGYELKTYDKNVENMMLASLQVDFTGLELALNRLLPEGTYYFKLAVDTKDLKINVYQDIYKDFKSEVNKNILMSVCIALIVICLGGLAIVLGKRYYDKKIFILYRKIPFSLILITQMGLIAYWIFYFSLNKMTNEPMRTLFITQIVVSAMLHVSDIMFCYQNGLRERFKSDINIINRILGREIELTNKSKLTVSMDIILFIVLIILISILAIRIHWASYYTPIYIYIPMALCILILIKRNIDLKKDIKAIEDVTSSVIEGNFNIKYENEKCMQLKKVRENISNIDKGFKFAIEEELKSERMKAELITNVSHDLKTPLTSIINYVDLLQMIGIPEDEKREYLKILDKKSKRLKVLIEDLFEASKASTGNIKLNIENIDIVSVLRQTLAEFKDKIDDSELDFKINLPSEKIMLDLDGARTWRVFENLIGNTLKYSLDRSRVYIDLKEKNNKVVFEIKNISGYELNCDPSELKERFKRADISRHTEGSGLGLSIANSLVELQNGKLDINIDGDLFKVKIEFFK